MHRLPCVATIRATPCMRQPRHLADGAAPCMLQLAVTERKLPGLLSSFLAWLPTKT